MVDELRASQVLLADRAYDSDHLRQPGPPAAPLPTRTPWCAGSIDPSSARPVVPVMLDPTLVRAHQQAATGKGGRQDTGSGALLRRRSDDQDPNAGRRAGAGPEDYPDPGEAQEDTAAPALLDAEGGSLIADGSYDTIGVRTMIREST